MCVVKWWIGGAESLKSWKASTLTNEQQAWLLTYAQMCNFRWLQREKLEKVRKGWRLLQGGCPISCAHLSAKLRGTDNDYDLHMGKGLPWSSNLVVMASLSQNHMNLQLCWGTCLISNADLSFDAHGFGCVSMEFSGTSWQFWESFPSSQDMPPDS